MRHARVFAALMPLLSLLIACNPDDGDDQPTPPVPPPQITAVWRGEATEYCTSGIRLLQGDVEGDQPEEVELLRNGQRVSAFTPPYQFQVNCDQEPEGGLLFQIRARRGTHSVTSPGKTLVIDRTAPSVTWTSPNHTADIRKDSPIYFEFQEPVKGQFASATSLTSDFAPLPHTATLSADGRKLTLVPAQPLRAPARLEAVLYRGGITDLAGLPLKESEVRASWNVWPFAHMGAAVENAVAVAVTRAPSGTPWMAGRALGRGITVRHWGPQGWTAFGSELTGNTISGRLALALGPGDEPIVASVEDPGSTDAFVRVMRWSNGGWQQLGANLDADATTDFIQGLSVAADRQGNPTVVWHENFSVHVRRWNGTAWEPLGAPIGSRSSDDTKHPVVAVDSQNRVVVAYSQQLPNSFYNRVFVQRWEGSAWAPVGTSLASTDVFGINDVDLAIGPGDAPVVTWIESGNTYQVFAARWATGAWQRSPVLGTAAIEDLSIAADANGRVLVGWWNEDPVLGLNRRLVHTARFENGAWSTGVTACVGDDPHVSFTAEGTPMLWATRGNTGYQPFIEH